MNVTPKSYAVVTGACSGIGYQFARALAARGYRLVMVSNRDKEIHEAAEKVTVDFGVETRPLCLDLARPEAAEQLMDFCKDWDVEVLINNAGVFSFADVGPRTPPFMELILGLHVATLSRLTVGFGERMKQRGGGYILNSSSLAGYFAFPGISLYASTKGYVRLFSESLWYEYRPHHVTVMALCPGAVATDLYGLPAFYQHLGIRLGIICRPEKMVQKALKRLFKGRRVYIPYPLLNVPMKGVMELLPACLIGLIYRKVKRFQK